MKATMSGIDKIESYLQRGNFKTRRVGILCHPSSVDRKHKHLSELVERSAKLVSFFGPQHGIHGETQDNMIEWQDHQDERGRPIYSLYGERRIPTQESVSELDLMIIDLFDVGARYYTFIYTMAYMLEVCGKAKVPVVICDRPNPLGGQFVEGPILHANYKSFVGLYELPICHGMSIGELASFFCSQMDSPPQFKVLKASNWSRSQNFKQTGQTWLLPSPNMPSFETCRLYPGMCLLEATSLSEGRGTTRPFELIGAPFMNWSDIEREYLRETKKLSLPAVQFHRQGFIPTFHKHAGELCRGALQLPPLRNFQPARHAVVLLYVLRKLYGQEWKWKSPPYEYEFKKLPIDILAGGPQIRECIDEQGSLKKLFSDWKEDEKKFKKLRRRFLLYS